MVPLVASCFGTNGLVSGSTQSGLVTAAGTMLTTLSAAGLQLVVWHRPKGSTPSGGVVAGISAGSVPVTPSGLRSRRS
jgi:hypothetical protein